MMLSKIKCKTALRQLADLSQIYQLQMKSSFRTRRVSKSKDKLRRELLSLETSEWAQSQYLRNVITESQRLFPSTANGSVRVTGCDIDCKSGSMIIPKGLICVFAQIVLHRDESIFVDADTFKPERWETSDEGMRGSFLPFALGNRNCVG